MDGYGETGVYGDLPYKGEEADDSFGVLLLLMPHNIKKMSSGAFKQISNKDNIVRKIAGSVFNSTADRNYQVLKMIFPN